MLMGRFVFSEEPGVCESTVLEAAKEEKPSWVESTSLATCSAYIPKAYRTASISLVGTSEKTTKDPSQRRSQMRMGCTESDRRNLQGFYCISIGKVEGELGLG